MLTIHGTVTPDTLLRLLRREEGEHDQGRKGVQTDVMEHDSTLCADDDHLERNWAIEQGAGENRI